MRIKQIVELLSERIHSGDVVTEGRLLPERELAETLGINRPALRQALAVLEILGITEVRPRDGIYVKNKTDLVGQNIDFFSMWPADVIPQVFELRTILEPHAAALAAARRDETDIERMRATHERMINLSDRQDEDSYVTFLRWNRIFHEVIVKASKNQILEQTYIANLAAYERALTYMRQNDEGRHAFKWPLLTVDEHAKIIEAIEKRQEEDAFNLMKEHIKDGAMRAEQFRKIVDVDIFKKTER